MTYVYLASPYSHPDPQTRHFRYTEAMRCVAWLLNNRICWPHSPILHCHPLVIAHNLPTDHHFWLPYNQAMLLPASKLLILTLPGWQDSAGVDHEVTIAHEIHKPIEFITPAHLDSYIHVPAPETANAI